MASKRIALDAMGGDHAPDALVAGAALACSEEGIGLAPERLLLVGDQERLAPLIEPTGLDLQVLHASQVVEMSDSAAAALRSKPDSSIAKSVGAVREGAAGALVSMGNTGACVAASAYGLGTLPGIRRPGIAVTFRLTDRPITILDMGANSAPKPEHLAQYGLMGSRFAQDCLAKGAANPRVGLLNIGEEAGKGTGLLKEAFALLETSPIDFVGNVEPGDIFKDVADVVVTDGFTGNVVLKLMEEFAGFVVNLVTGELKAHGATWGPEAMANLGRRLDYAQYGGAMLLGVGGVVVIGHGRSDATAVSNAIGLARRALDAGVNDDIVRGVEEASSAASPE